MKRPGGTLQIVNDIASAMSDVNARALNQARAQTNLKKEIWDRRDFILKQLELMTLDVKNKIHSITEDVEYKVRQSQLAYLFDIFARAVVKGVGPRRT